MSVSQQLLRRGWSERCYFYTVTIFSNPVHFSKCKKVFVSCCSRRNASRWFQGQGSSCPTHKAHTSLIVIGRAVFLKVSELPLCPPVAVWPLTLYSSSFNVSFILPRKRHCDTEAKETSKSYFSLRLYNKFFFRSHFSESWGWENFSTWLYDGSSCQNLDRGFLLILKVTLEMMERGSVTCRGYFGRVGFFRKSEWHG